MSGAVLPASFYNRPTLRVAKELLGKYVIRETPSGCRAGRIIEVEAYVGLKDRASHASRGRTKRSEIMFGPPGIAYVYMIYGMYHCLNVVTERVEYPAAILIRAVEEAASVIDGPGRLCRAYAIDRSLNYHDLTKKELLWIEDRGVQVPRTSIGAYPRVGVDYAGAWAHKPWRFRIR